MYGEWVCQLQEFANCLSRTYTVPNFHAIFTFFNLSVMPFYVSMPEQCIFGSVFAWDSLQ
jgi:hypothetical protein